MLHKIYSDEEQSAYDAGYSAAIDGSDTTNCHFSIFSTPEKMKAWESGKQNGDVAAKDKTNE